MHFPLEVREKMEFDERKGFSGIEKRNRICKVICISSLLSSILILCCSSIPSTLGNYPFVFTFVCPLVCLCIYLSIHHPASLPAIEPAAWLWYIYSLIIISSVHLFFYHESTHFFLFNLSLNPWIEEQMAGLKDVEWSFLPFVSGQYVFASVRLSFLPSTNPPTLLHIYLYLLSLPEFVLPSLHSVAFAPSTFKPDQCKSRCIVNFHTDTFKSS